MSKHFRREPRPRLVLCGFLKELRGDRSRESSRVGGCWAAGSFIPLSRSSETGPRDPAETGGEVGVGSFSEGVMSKLVPKGGLWPLCTHGPFPELKYKGGGTGHPW